MADRDTNGGRTGEVREARPENARQDPHNAAQQEQVHADTQAMRESARRVEATTPPEIRDRTVGEIVQDADRKADRDGRTGTAERLDAGSGENGSR